VITSSKPLDTDRQRIERLAIGSERWRVEHISFAKWQAMGRARGWNGEDDADGLRAHCEPDEAATITFHNSLMPASHSFFILMIDYGKGPKRPIGLEAIVDPEHTRRAIVDQARDILSEGRNEIAFIKFVDGNFICDVTAEIIADARVLMEDA
jgi:hypothetical protein